MTKALFASVFILLANTSINYVKANGNSVCGTLTVKSGCLCPGSSIVYQCAVNGSVEGLTVWQMSGCSGEISLHHDNSFVNSSGMGCLNVHGTGISINNDCYISELTINNISARNIGENITCSLDVGSEILTVGHRTLSVPSDFLSLNTLHQIDSPQGELSFTWEPLIITDCPSLHYNVTATEGCGICQNSVSDNFTTCTNVQRGKSCTFSVFVNLCSDLIMSDAITVSTGILPMIANLRQSMDDSSEAVMLIWDLMNASYCSLIDYVVNATEGCGSCSVSRERNTATCRDVGRGITCTFFIFANVCGDHIRNETTLILNTGPLGGTPVGAIAGIAVGVAAAVAVGIIFIAVAVWINGRHHRHKYKFPRGQGESRELQVGVHDTRSHSNDSEEEGKRQATDDDDDGRPTSHKSLTLDLQCKLENDERNTSGSCDSPGTFGRFSSKLSQIVVIGGSLKQAVVGEVTTVTVLFKQNKNKSTEHVPNLSGDLWSDSESIVHPIQCEVNEIEHNNKYELKFTPIMRGQHQLHIKADNAHVEGSPYAVIVRPSVHNLGDPVRIIGEHKIIEPGGLTFNEKGEILVVEGGRQCVSTFSREGTNLSSFGSPTLLGEHILSKPHGVAVLDDTILVTDSGKHCISMFTSEGNFIKSVGELGSGPLQFDEPMGISIHPSSKHIYVTEYKNNRIQVLKLEPDLKFVDTFGSKGEKHGEFIKPWDVSFNSDGFVYIADSGNHRIQVFEYRDSKWNFIRTIGKEGRDEGQLMWPSSVFIDHKNQNLVYVTEDDNYRVSIFTDSGEFLNSFGKKGTSPGEFDLPHGIIVDENGYIYVSDHKNNSIQVF